MSLHGLLTFLALAAAIVIRLLYFFAPLTVSGFMPKRWQRWMLGSSPSSKTPKGGDVLM